MRFISINNESSAFDFTDTLKNPDGTYGGNIQYNELPGEYTLSPDFQRAISFADAGGVAAEGDITGEGIGEAQGLADAMDDD